MAVYWLGAHERTAVRKAVTLCSLKELTNPSVLLGHTVILDSNSFPKSLIWTRCSYPASWTKYGHWMQSTGSSVLTWNPRPSWKDLAGKKRGQTGHHYPWSGPILCPTVIYPYPDSWNPYHRNLMASNLWLLLCPCALWHYPVIGLVWGFVHSN